MNNEQLWRLLTESKVFKSFRKAKSNDNYTLLIIHYVSFKRETIK